MSQRYIDLIEKIEKQNSYSLKDKMEVQYQLRDISEKTHSMLGKNNKVLKNYCYATTYLNMWRQSRRYIALHKNPSIILAPTLIGGGFFFE